jgi:hypothetical protein
MCSGITARRRCLAAVRRRKPALIPLPVEPFRYYQYGERTVHLDGCVEIFSATRYSLLIF